jgi:hypothetical protein
MFGWKSLFKNKSPPGGGETGWQPDGLDAAFPPKPFGAAAGRDPNLILMTESGAAHGGYGGFGGSAMVGTAGGLQIDLVWESSVNNAPAGSKSAATAAGSIDTADLSNPITVPSGGAKSGISKPT